MEEALLPDPKSQIKLLLRENQPLSKENLDDIERLFSLSEIKRLVNLSPDTYHTFIAHPTIFSTCWYAKIRKALEKVAVERLKKDPAFEQHIPDDLLFPVVLNVAWSLKWHNKKNFCSPKNHVTRLALIRIKRDIAIPEKRASALRRLENFPIELIKETILSIDGFQLEKTEAKHFKITTLWAEHTTPDFQEVLNTKNVDAFIQKINTANAETVEKLMCQLATRIKSSFFKDKYEQMLEACFVRMMELTPPREAMKLDSQVIIECLGVFHGYMLKRSRKRFFEKSGRDGYNMLAYFIRTVPSFNAFPKFRALLPSYTLEEVAQFDDARLEEEIKSGKLDSQKILVDAVWDKDFVYGNLASRLVLTHGANLDWMELNYTSHIFANKYKIPYKANGEFSQLNFLLYAIWTQKQPPWDLYVASKGGDLNAVLEGIIDSYIHCLAAPRITIRNISQLFEKCEEKIGELLENPAVVVTQEMVDKFDILQQADDPQLSGYGKGEGIKKMLEDKRVQQGVPASSDKKGKEEIVLDISADEAAIAVRALAARDSVEKRRASSTESVEPQRSRSLSMDRK